MTDLTNPIFTNEAAAVAHLESSRWATGLSCPLCGSDKAKKMGGQTQAGMFLCGDCRGKFTVRTGTVFERSHIPLHKWLLATHLMASSKKGISAHQLHRMLGITYKSAWFMAHRIREAMAPADTSPMGSGGGIAHRLNRRATFVQSLVTIPALSGLFERIKLLLNELREVDLLYRLADEERAKKIYKDRGFDPLERRRTQDVPAQTARLREVQKVRLSLPPLPEFPDEAQVVAEWGALGIHPDSEEKPK